MYQKRNEPQKRFSLLRFIFNSSSMFLAVSFFVLQLLYMMDKNFNIHSFSNP